MKKFTLLFFILTVSSGISYAETVNICTDMNSWYPFTYKEKGESKGMHVDITAQALENLGYKMKFTPIPWNRCLQMTEQGSYDALVSGSYKLSRAESFFYPPDASDEKKSEWRIMQVEYVLITPIDNPYKFKGEIKTLPTPIRAPLGYSIVEDLRAKNIKVITGKTIRNLRTVAKLKKGGVITIPTNAEMLIRKLGFENKLKIHDIPIKSKSYFMMFSKITQHLSNKEMLEIWNEIARLRDNKEFMTNIQSKYD